MIIRWSLWTVVREWPRQLGRLYGSVAAAAAAAARDYERRYGQGPGVSAIAWRKSTRAWVRWEGTISGQGLARSYEIRRVPIQGIGARIIRLKRKPVRQITSTSEPAKKQTGSQHGI